MTELFSAVLRMSLSGSLLVAAVLLVRLLLRNAPKWILPVLWLTVALRLICPVAPEASVSMIPDSIAGGRLIAEWKDDYVGDIKIFHDSSPDYDAAVSAGRIPMFDGSGGQYVVTAGDGISSPKTVESAVMPALAALWLCGIAAMTLYTAISYRRIRRRVRTAVMLTENIYRSEAVDSPFVLGFIKPKIYLPFDMEAADMAHVIAHEQAHIRRRDHWWKPIGFALLTLHWFNPLMWLAYILLCRDIELACDEKVIKELGTDQRADYSQALLNCSVNRARIAACPLAFGEVGVKARVKSVLNYKKPAFWIILSAVILCAVVAVCFLTDPISYSRELPDYAPLRSLPGNYSLEQAAADGCVIMEDGDVTSGKDIWLTFLRVTKTSQKARVRYIHYYSGKDTGNSAGTLDLEPRIYIHDLTYDGKNYTVRWYEAGKENSKTFRHLLHFTDAVENEQAAYLATERYVLTNDPNVTWKDIWQGLLSSISGLYIDHLEVYKDLIREGDDLSGTLPEEKPGVQGLTAEITTPGAVTLRVPFSYIWGYWGVYLIGQNEPEYTGNGDVPYNGALGKYRMVIRFGDAEPTSEFTQRFPAEEVITLMKAGSDFGSDLKVKVTYPNDHGFWIYIGSDVPFTTEEQIHHGEQLDGTLEIPLQLAEAPAYATTKWPLAASPEITVEGLPGVTFTYERDWIYVMENGQKAQVIAGMPILNAFFTDLTGDRVPELCTTVLLGSGIVDSRICVYDHIQNQTYTLQDRGRFDYSLTFEDGVVMLNKRPYMQSEPVESRPLSMAEIVQAWQQDQPVGELRFRAEDLSEVNEILLTNNYNAARTVKITDQEDIQDIIQYLTGLTGTDPHSGAGYYGIAYSLRLVSNTKTVTINFGDEDTMYYGYHSDDYPVRYRLQNSNSKRILDFLRPYDIAGTNTDTYPKARIAALVDLIVKEPNSTAGQAAPGELRGYGKYTLRYAFESYLSGAMTRQQASVLSNICSQILAGWEDVGFIEGNTPQQIFENYRSRVLQLASELTDDQMQYRYPGACVLLAVLEEQDH